ncbi:MAG: hypothetical protein MZV49_02325 [Rhodopseudomonas palustris]|nr:hypothetical protein [Rhodopseudomonas palustris]
MTQIIRVFESGPEASKAANAAADELRAGSFGAVRVASLPAGIDDRVAAARAALSDAGFSPAEGGELCAHARPRRCVAGRRSAVRPRRIG